MTVSRFNPEDLDKLAYASVLGSVADVTEHGIYIIGAVQLKVVNSLDDLEQTHCATCRCRYVEPAIRK